MAMTNPQHTTQNSQNGPLPPYPPLQRLALYSLVVPEIMSPAICDALRHFQAPSSLHFHPFPPTPSSHSPWTCSRPNLRGSGVPLPPLALPTRPSMQMTRIIIIIKRGIIPLWQSGDELRRKKRRRKRTERRSNYYAATKRSPRGGSD
jgi:hypothetical protein